MPPRGLTQAATRYGLGLDYQVDGITTVTGSVPPTVDLAERTEDGFGQGKVLVTPFGMALVAATVDAGKTPVPQLIAGRATTVEGDSTPITPKMIDALRPMMRLVVTNGTVANHVAHVLAKLGVDSRVLVAVEVVRHQSRAESSSVLALLERLRAVRQASLDQALQHVLGHQGAPATPDGALRTA